MFSSKLWIIFLCILLTSLVAAAPHKKVVLSPSKDPFYQPPTGFEKQAPGTILRSRTLGPKSLAAFAAFPQNIKNAYQYLYRTTDAHGKPDATVTTLIVPFQGNASRLVSYQAMEDSASNDCNPSHVLRKGDGLKGVITQVELLYIDTLLEHGYYVNTADYEGSKASFTAGAMAGHAVLDSIRAVLSSGQLNQHADVQMWGYSGGALATGWAAQLQPTYASELKIIGAAMGGTPVDLNATLNAVAGGPAAGLAMSGINGLTNQYPELATYVDSVLLPNKKKAFYRAKDLCLGEILLEYAFQRMSSYVNRPDYTNAPVAKKILEASVMGRTNVPKIPLFMYHAIHDEAVPYKPAGKMYNDWCGKGADIEFVKDELSEHVVLYITGSANAIMYLEDRFQGIPVQQGCSARTTVTSLLDKGALEVFGKTILDALIGLLGLPLGPGHL
ncbi:secretory lipase-domain-containing protein [Chlamydoabsidia padenii]|nr:secretory lipase-domain-containing protein [Chlamydoabsidia padenii]